MRKVIQELLDGSAAVAAMIIAVLLTLSNKWDAWWDHPVYAPAELIRVMVRWESVFRPVSDD